MEGAFTSARTTRCTGLVHRGRRLEIRQAVSRQLSAFSHTGLAGTLSASNPDQLLISRVSATVLQTAKRLWRTHSCVPRRDCLEARSQAYATFSGGFLMG